LVFEHFWCQLIADSKRTGGPEELDRESDRKVGLPRSPEGFLYMPKVAGFE
jgi:hypothetical protein